jgi:hypothetical protein
MFLRRNGEFISETNHQRLATGPRWLYAGRVTAPAGGTRLCAEAAAAAARLRHDLGRYIRLSAPRALESDTEELRARLAFDVRATRSGESGPVAAPEVFDAWLRDAARVFPRSGELADRLADIASAIEEIRALEPRLDSLPRGELERLDRLTREIAEGCARLWEAARGEGGPK